MLINMLTIIGLFSPMIAVADPSKSESSDIAARHVHIRSLAASCAACHGTNGNSSGNAAKLAAIDKAYFMAQMQAFKSGARASTVMHRHVKGLNTQEISDLAEYFSLQAPRKSSALPSQKLSRSATN
ncbi:MAG TPA: c-type cytochrome [Methylotenera sp.]|nr:c-type cytochrome [Methylotenera sp.]